MLGETVNTEFPTGNLDSFLNEINTPKQDMNITQESVINNSDIADEQTPSFTPPNQPNQEVDNNEFKLDGFTTEAAAEMLVGIIDTALPAGLALLSKTGKSEDFQAPKEQKKTLIKGFKNYLDAKGIDLPPGWMLFFLIVTIYGIEVPTAIAMRKEYNAISENEKRIAEQQRQIELQKKQIAALRKEKQNIETENGNNNSNNE